MNFLKSLFFSECKNKGGPSHAQHTEGSAVPWGPLHLCRWKWYFSQSYTKYFTELANFLSDSNNSDAVETSIKDFSIIIIASSPDPEWNKLADYLHWEIALQLLQCNCYNANHNSDHDSKSFWEVLHHCGRMLRNDNKNLIRCKRVVVDLHYSCNRSTASSTALSPTQ